MIVETAERVGPGPGQLRDRCCRAVGEMVVQALWRGQLHFQPAIYIPEPVERTVREWVECVPTCLRYKHKLTAFITILSCRQDILNRSSHILFSTYGGVAEMSSSTVPIMLAALMETLYCPSLKAPTQLLSNGIDDDEHYLTRGHPCFDT